MEYGKAFTFLTEDEKWLTKLLIGGVLAFAGGLLLPLFLLYGYSFEILQNVAAGNPRPAPEWDRLEDKFKKGLYLFAIRIVYFLPILLVFCCFGVLFFAVSAATTPSSTGVRPAANPLSGVLSVLYFCVVCVGIVYGVIATIVGTFASIITCGIGAPFVTAWVEYAQMHLLGQIFVKSGLPLPPAAPLAFTPPPTAAPFSPTLPPA